MLARSETGGYIPVMQTAASAVQDHRLTLPEVLQALVAEGIVPRRMPTSSSPTGGCIAATTIP